MIQKILWLLLAAVHAMPAVAFFRPAMLTQLYGVSAADPAFLLLRHRAALFVCVLIGCIWAAFDPATRRLVVPVAAVSMGSFLWLFVQSGSPSALRTIAAVDLAALPLLMMAAWAAYGR